VNPEESSAVWLLALGLLLIYAGSYYAFPALLPMLEAETGWGNRRWRWGRRWGR